MFDQSVINEGRLHYIQAISNQTADHFTFDVTNGISELKDLVFHFTILPKTLYVETRELIATEGGEATLTTHNLHVITDYYVDKIEDLPPKKKSQEIQNEQNNSQEEIKKENIAIKPQIINKLNKVSQLKILKIS